MTRALTRLLPRSEVVVLPPLVIANATDRATCDGDSHDRIGDRTDELGRDFVAVLLDQETLDLTNSHPACEYDNDLVGEPGNEPFVPGNQ